jgi:hypothetical protein
MTAFEVTKKQRIVKLMRAVKKRSKNGGLLIKISFSHMGFY